MKWWEVVLICAWPSGMGIALMLGWVKGHKAGVEFAQAQRLQRNPAPWID